MSDPIPSQALTLNHLSYAYSYLKDYLTSSKEKYKAWLLLLAILITIGLIAYSNVLFSYWTIDFWTSITLKQLSLFWGSMGSFVVLTGGWIILSVLRNFLIESFSIGWREWMTERFLADYTGSESDNYLDAARMSEQLDNPQQRIQGDIKNFVGLSCWMTTDLLSSILRLVTFLSSLWIVGGSLACSVLGMNLVIPGYLVWVAIIFSGMASLITQNIGRVMSALTTRQEKNEADFRKDMEFMANESESIALEWGESFFKKLLSIKLGKMITNLYERMYVRLKVIGFQNFYQQLASIFPYLAAAPLYFIGKIEMETLMLISYSFGEVNSGFNWFVESFEKIADFQSSLCRVIELEETLGNSRLKHQPRDIQLQPSQGADIVVQALSVSQPHHPEFMMHRLDITLKRGEHVVIRGDSGLGKSTFLKVLAGTWAFGHGSVSIPKNSSAFFMAQKPTIPHGATLKEILSYPVTQPKYSDALYGLVLTLVGLGSFVDQLNQDDILWHRTLSGGQQQRISFARALLIHPDWLFLDEATASLDPRSELQMYQLLKKELPHTTLVSIAHRDSVEQYHDKTIRFFANHDDGQTQYQVTEIPRRQNELIA